MRQARVSARGWCIYSKEVFHCPTNRLRNRICFPLLIHLNDTRNAFFFVYPNKTSRKKNAAPPGLEKEKSQSRRNVNIFVFDGEKYFVSYLFNKHCSGAERGILLVQNRRRGVSRGYVIVSLAVKVVLWRGRRGRLRIYFAKLLWVWKVLQLSATKVAFCQKLLFTHKPNSRKIQFSDAKFPRESLRQLKVALDSSSWHSIPSERVAFAAVVGAVAQFPRTSRKIFCRWIDAAEWIWSRKFSFYAFNLPMERKKNFFRPLQRNNKISCLTIIESSSARLTFRIVSCHISSINIMHVERSSLEHAEGKTIRARVFSPLARAVYLMTSGGKLCLH